MLGRQVQQALRVYTTHGTFWLWVFVWFLWHVLLLLAYFLTSEAQIVVLIVPMSAMLGFEIGQTLAAQFANPRARLLPEFARAHLIAAGGLVTAAVGAVLLSACLLRVPVLGALGLSIVAFGLAILVAVNKGPMNYGAWVVLGTMLLLPWVFGLPWFHVLFTDPGFHAALGGIGLVAMVGAASWLVSLCEDSPGYSAISSGLDWDADQDQATDQQRRQQAREAAVFSERATLRDALLSMAFRWMPGPGRWRRIMLRQVAQPTPILTLLLIQAVFLLLILWRGSGGGSLDIIDHFHNSAMPFGVAIIVAWRPWPIRLDHLAWESLLPLARKDLVRELAFTNRLEASAAAAGHCVLIAASAALAADREMPFGFMSAWLALIAVQYMVGYHLMFWLNSFGPSCLVVIVMGIACLALPGAITALLTGVTIATLNNAAAVYWHAGTAAGLMLAILASIGLHRLAVRRWCQIDLDWSR